MFFPSFVDGRELWLLIFAFYFFGNFCLIDEKHIVVLEDHYLKWSFRFSSIPFVVLKKPLYVLQLLTPYTFAFKMPWQIADPNTPFEMIRRRRQIAVWRSRLCLIRVLSSAAFLNLFVLGPYLTISYSLIFALTIVGPLHVVLLACVIVQLLTHRRLLNYNDKTHSGPSCGNLALSRLFAECLPQISLSYNCADIDGVVFVLRFSPTFDGRKVARRASISKVGARDRSRSQLKSRPIFCRAGTVSTLWDFLLVAICAIVGYVAVAAVLARRGRKQERQKGGRAKRRLTRSPEPETSFETLKVSPFASKEEIKAAFRLEIAKYHPDQVAHLGIELRVLADERSKKINRAYVEALRVRGGR